MPTSPDKQVPASIVADAVFPISKTWYDAVASIYPQAPMPALLTRLLERLGLISDTDDTSVRAGIIAGSTLSSMTSSTAAPAYYLDNLTVAFTTSLVS